MKRIELESPENTTLVIHMTEDMEKSVVNMLEALQKTGPGSITEVIRFDPKGKAAIELAAQRNRSTVQYRAVGGSDALDALGATTVNGIIFSHILHNGPLTVKQIREDKPYSDKAIQSVVHRLKHMDLVEAEPIEA